MEKVLVIEDCHELREVVSDMLEDAGFSVFSAKDSEDVDAICRKEHFSLILCDLVLPIKELTEVEEGGESVMVGVHMVHKLSRQFPTTPIVIMSGKLVGEPLTAIKQFGARAVLSKPFGRDELIETMERILGREDSCSTSL